MSLPKTKYPNNQRVVSGSVNVTSTDVVLLCDTSNSPVTINLMTIPSDGAGGYTAEGFWSTQYKLYVVDFTQNSAVNNITISAPAGFKINSQTSQVLNNNGGSLIIEVVSNEDYITLGSLSGLSGANIPYIIGEKFIYKTGVNYFPTNTNFSVRNGLAVDTYDAKAETGVLVNTFDSPTGIWTCPATGVYNLGMYFFYQINIDPNNPQDASNNYWMTTPAPSGVLSLASFGEIQVGIANPNPSQALFTVNTQVVTQNTSDVTIAGSQLNVPINAGTKLQLFVLNRTNHNIIGLGLSPGYPTRILFSIQKIA